MSNNFAHVEYPTRHGAIERYENVVATVQSVRKSFGGLAIVLLAAMVSALLVVADQLIDTWAEGHLLAAWVLMWLIGFAAVALLAPTARRLARRTLGVLDGWSHRVARRRADDRLWDLARRDARVMADIQAAATRADVAAPAVAVAASAPAINSAETAARLQRLRRRIWNE